MSCTVDKLEQISSDQNVLAIWSSLDGTLVLTIDILVP